MEIQLTAFFYDEFQNKGITAEIVRDISRHYDAIEKVENDVKFYLKNYDTKEIKSTLLLGTAWVENEEIFAFAYWIPKDLCDERTSLLGMLRQFCNRFGCKIKIGETEDYLIEYEEKVIFGEYYNISQVIRNLPNNQIPITLHEFHEIVHGKPLSLVRLYYAFCINHHKYLGWLKNVPVKRYTVSKHWAQQLSSAQEVLNPFYRVDVKFSKSKTDHEARALLDDGYRHSSIGGDLATDEAESYIDIPLLYEKSFDRIVSLIPDLDISETLFIRVKLPERKKCVFCDSTKLSAEHIAPKWFRKYFKQEDWGINMHRGEDTENVAHMLTTYVQLPSESSYGYTINKVCIECNTTWMSTLEERVEKVIAPYINAELPIACTPKFNSSDSFMISKWLVVKSALLSVKLEDIKRFPDNIFHSLKDGNILPKFVVDVFLAKSHDLSFFMGYGSFLAPKNNSRISLAKVEKAEQVLDKLFYCALHVGWLIFRVSFFIDSDDFAVETYIKPDFTLFPLDANLPFHDSGIDMRDGKAIDKPYLMPLGLGLRDL